MSNESESTEELSAVSAEELSKLRDALTARYGVKLRPGESLTVDAERSKEQCWVKIEIATADETYLLEAECAALPEDVPPIATWKPATAYDDVLDMLDAQLRDYFDSDRFAKWHDDWRLYDFGDSVVRFRGRESRPDLEALADAWLATNGPADDGEPN